MKVLQFPLTRITIGFIAGIIFAYYFKINLHSVFRLGLFVLIVFGIVFLIQSKYLKKSILFGIFAYIVSFLIGISTLIINTETVQKNHYTHFAAVFEKKNLIKIVIQEKIKNTKKNNRYIANVTQINFKNYSGKIILNIKKSDSLSNLESGTQLLLNSSLLKNKPPYNPNQFDYGKYLENKQIYAQAFTTRKEVLIDSYNTKTIAYYISRFRTTIIQNLKKIKFNQKELDVANALILGQKQDVAQEIMQDYQYAGAIHILSVSGLHIGSILLFLNFLLKPIPNTKRGSLIKLITCISLLWLFAFVASLAPSIVRSVTMFSFVAIGYYLRRSTNIYHTIIISILLILLFQPYFLFDVGFQLSYLALFFIIWLQPMIANIWKPNTKFTKSIWEILSVSIAAQIGTLPLCLYYFHQFPGLFFITNLIIIPMLSFVMILGLIVMILASLNFTPMILTKPFEWSIFSLNKIMNEIASYKTFVIQEISFNSHLMFSSYLLIVCMIIWFKKPKFNNLVWALIGIIIFQIMYFKTQWEIHNGKEWIVFNENRNTMITERKGNIVSLFTNDFILAKPLNNSTLNSYLVANFCEIKEKNKIANFMCFNQNKILVIDSSGIIPFNIHPDILVLTQTPKINLDRILKNIHPKIVIADASNYKTIQKFWKQSCTNQKIPFHATAEKGFFRLY